jgi:hypothetical protein
MKTLNNNTELLSLENNLINLLSENENNLVAVASTIKGNSISYIKEYYSKSSGKVSNYFLRLGYSLENALNDDLKTVASNYIEVIENFEDDYSHELIDLVYNEILSSLEKRTSSEEFKAKLLAENDSTIIRSKAQNDAFTTLAKGVSLHNDTNQIYIVGLELNKNLVEVRNEVKPTKSSEKTILKNKIKMFLDLKETKIRRFNFDKSLISLQGLKIQG